MIPGRYGPRSYKKKWLFFIILIAFSGFVIYDHRPEIIDDFYAGNYQEMVILVILLFPLFFAFKVLAKGNHYRRFGDTPLIIRPQPLILGQPFNGNVSINRGVKYLNDMQFSAEILLSETSESNEGDNYNTRVDILWRQTLPVVSQFGATGAVLSVKGDLPNDVEASSNKSQSITSGGSRYHWQLSITSSNKKFRQLWDLPVSKSVSID